VGLYGNASALKGYELLQCPAFNMLLMHFTNLIGLAFFVKINGTTNINTKGNHNIKGAN